MKPADRFWLAAVTSLLPRGRWAAVFAATPGTDEGSLRVLHSIERLSCKDASVSQRANWRLLSFAGFGRVGDLLADR